MAQLNTTQTTEQLMLLKGTRDKLATLDITPGAVYFTTDYPGIYVDFAAEGEEGSTDYKEARRVRMGDVTVVDTLDELKNLAVEFITAGQKLGKDTLYYAKDKNVLCIYDEGEGKFVWVNDVSALTSRVSDLEDRMGIAETDIENLEIAIGTSYSTAGDGSVYGAIAQLAVDVKETTDDLQDQIDAILGEGNGSISDLQDQIDGINDAIGDDGLGGRISILETTVGGEGGHGTRLDTIEDKLDDIEDGAEVNIINRIEVLIDGIEDPCVDAPDAYKVVQITLPQDLTKYDGTGVIDGIDQSFTAINTEITNIKGANWDVDKPTIQGNATAIADLKGSESKYNSATVTGNASNIATLKGDTDGYADATVSGNASNIATLKGDTDGYADATVSGNASSIANLTTELETAVINLEYQIEQSADDTNAELTVKINDLRKDLTDKINDNFAAADAMTFKGGVGFKTGGEELNLPTVNVKAGDTYVIECDEENYTSGEVTQYHAGDMMIALYDQPASRFKSVVTGAKLTNNVPADVIEAYALGTTIETTYIEYLDNNFGNYIGIIGMQATEQDHKNNVLGACGYMKNEIGQLTPVLFTMWGVGDVDYGEVLWYTGRADVSGVTYDTWKYTEYVGGIYSDAMTRYYYTNILVQDNEYPLENWTHVKTGYDGAHEAKLSVPSGDATGNKIQLTSHVGVDLGSVSFESKSTNIAVSKDAENGAIKFNLVWGTF